MATFLVTLAAIFIVPPLSDVVAFLLGRQLNLASLELVRDEMKKIPAANKVVTEESRRDSTPRA